MRVMILMLYFVVMACQGDDPVGKTSQSLCQCEPNLQDCCCDSPIVIDVNGDGIALTSWKEGVVFNMVPWHGATWRAWTEENSDDAWLALDTDYNKKVTDGTELFGNVTLQPEPAVGEKKNGFLALAQYDENADGQIDESDEVYARLWLWQDVNHDGASQSSELSGLVDLGVAAISVKYDVVNKRDGLGNLYAYSAPVTPLPGASVGMTAWDVVLSSPTSKEREEYELPEPQPLPDPQGTDIPLPVAEVPVVSNFGTDLTKLFLPLYCTWVHDFEGAPYMLSAFSVYAPQATWRAESVSCPIYASSNVKLFNKYQGTWRERRSVSNTQQYEDDDPIVAVGSCPTYFHRSDWYAQYKTTFGSSYSPTSATTAGNVATLQCSAYPPPAPCQ